MPYLLSLLLFLSASQAFGSADPLVQCRNDHAANSSAHIKCLEEALRAYIMQPDLLSNSADPASATGISVTASGHSENIEEPSPVALGAEQIRNRSQTTNVQEERSQVGIVSASYDSSGLGTFQIDNGQVWRETVVSPERQRLASEQYYSARIERGRFGGYRMYIDGRRWMLTVKRIE